VNRKHQATNTIVRYKLTKHHRKPRCVGGTSVYPKGNISLLRENEHRFWHSLFGAWWPEWIAAEISRKYLPRRLQVLAINFFGEKRDRREPKWHKKIQKKKKPKFVEWQFLFPRSLSPEEIVERINERFIDPEYSLVIVDREATNSIAAG